MASGLQLLLTYRFWELAPCLPNTFQRPDGQTRADRGLEHSTPSSVPQLPHEGHEIIFLLLSQCLGDTPKWEQLWAYPNHSHGCRISCIIFRTHGLPAILLFPMQFLRETKKCPTLGAGVLGGRGSDRELDKLVSGTPCVWVHKCAQGCLGLAPGGLGCRLATPVGRGPAEVPPCCLLEEAAIAQPELLRQKPSPR